MPRDFSRHPEGFRETFRGTLRGSAGQKRLGTADLRPLLRLQVRVQIDSRQIVVFISPHRRALAERGMSGTRRSGRSRSREATTRLGIAVKLPVALRRKQSLQVVHAENRALLTHPRELVGDRLAEGGVLTRGCRTGGHRELATAVWPPTQLSTETTGHRDN